MGLGELEQKVGRLDNRRRRRESGRLINVWEPPVGTTLAADAAAGATTITVDDASVFDESGGSLYIGSQVTKYTGYDDESGVITLVDALSASADADDPVVRWSTLYGDVETVQYAEVAVEGDRDQADTLVVEVADSLDLRNGDRGLDGENCTIEREGDVWRLVSAHGRPSKLRGLKFETNDSYAVTAGDVTAGTVTIPLSQQPVSESLKLWWRATFQPPTEYAVNETAQTVTMVLGSYVAAGDVIYVHYAYRKGLAPPVPRAVNFTYVGATLLSGTQSSIAFPAGTQAGDMAVVAVACRASASPSIGDSRFSVVASGPFDLDTVVVATATVTSPGTPVTVSVTDLGGVQGAAAALYVIRPDVPVSFSTVTDSGSQVGGAGSIPGMSGVSGAIAVAVAAEGIGGAYGWVLGSPWTNEAHNGSGSYCYFSVASQLGSTIATTSGVGGGHNWRGFAIGVGLA